MIQIRRADTGNATRLIEDSCLARSRPKRPTLWPMAGEKDSTDWDRSPLPNYPFFQDQIERFLFQQNSHRSTSSSSWKFSLFIDWFRSHWKNWKRKRRFPLLQGKSKKALKEPYIVRGNWGKKNWRLKRFHDCCLSTGRPATSSYRTRAKLASRQPSQCAIPIPSRWSFLWFEWMRNEGACKRKESPYLGMSPSTLTSRRPETPVFGYWKINS